MTEEHPRGWPEPIKSEERRIRADVLERHKDLLTVDVDVIDKVRRWGGARLRETARAALPFAGMAELVTERARTLWGQVDRIDRWLNEGLLRLRTLEQRLPDIPTGGRIRVACLVAGGLVELVAATAAVVILLIGPTARYLVLPLLGDAVHQTSRLLGELTEELGTVAPYDDTASRLLQAKTIFGLGTAAALALGVAVVLVPDLICLFGRVKTRAHVLLLLLMKATFAASFYVVRTTDVWHPKPQIVAGSVFEFAVMIASTASVLAIAHHVDQTRGWWRERAAAVSGIHAIATEHARLQVLRSEVTERIALFVSDGWRTRLVESSFLEQMEEHGKNVAELALLEVVLKNRRALEDALGVEGPAEPVAAYSMN